MEALMATYASDSDSDDCTCTFPSSTTAASAAAATTTTTSCRSGGGGGASSTLPPPPLDLLPPPIGLLGTSCSQASRVRSFPHVEGHYALHVFIPVLVPSTARRMMVSFLKRTSSLVPDLHVVDVDIPIADLCKEDQMLEHVALARELHISLGRTVPIKVHQIDSIILMLRQKLLTQKRYWIDFDKWEVFVNDDLTRSFLSIEVTGGGLSQITKQIEIVNSVYRLHGLPEFYENPRPHISLLWALGDISRTLKQAVEMLDKTYSRLGNGYKHIFQCKFGGIVCKIGQKSYNVCQIADL